MTEKTPELQAARQRGYASGYAAGKRAGMRAPVMEFRNPNEFRDQVFLLALSSTINGTWMRGTPPNQTQITSIDGIVGTAWDVADAAMKRHKS